LGDSVGLVEIWELGWELAWEINVGYGANGQKKITSGPKSLEDAAGFFNARGLEGAERPDVPRLGTVGIWLVNDGISHEVDGVSWPAWGRRDDYITVMIETR